MKPGLQIDPHADITGKAAANEVLEQEILACQRGDWTAANRLNKTFQPLIHSLAEKRANGSTPELNRLMARGRDGLLRAARKYHSRTGASHFRLTAADFIVAAMDGRPGFWARLFGRR